MEGLLSTTKQRETVLANRKNRLAALINSGSKVHTADIPFIEEMSAEVRAEIEFLEKEHRFDFNFACGGWNTVWAKDKEEAYAKAIEEFSSFEVQKGSFRLCDSQRYDHLIRMSS